MACRNVCKEYISLKQRHENSYYNNLKSGDRIVEGTLQRRLNRVLDEFCYLCDHDDEEYFLNLKLGNTNVEDTLLKRLIDHSVNKSNGHRKVDLPNQQLFNKNYFKS